MAKKITYQEPVDFIPKSVRKELGLGEYNKDTSSNNAKSSNKSKTTKKSK